MKSSASEAAELRADARRNREQLLGAARDVFVERGPDAPLDEVARRAGVGIATLYRRFPDREALLRAVALDVLERAGHEARSAEAEEADAFRALGRYMHRALDLRISAVMPALLGHVSFEDETIRRAREQATAPVLRLVDAAHTEGTLRPDVAFGDVATILVRLSRPLPGPFPPDVDLGLAHRHVDLFLEGMRRPAPRGEPRKRRLRGEPGPAGTPEAPEARPPLPGPTLGLADLRSLGRGAASRR
jgi:AcrR family transcriptional regulator